MTGERAQSLDPAPPDAASPLAAPPDVATPGGRDPSLERRNDRVLLVAVGGYVALLTVLMIVRGVSITPDVLAIALGLAAVMLGRGRLFVRDWVPFVGLFLAYELMRGYADDFGTTVHVADVLAIERWLFLGHLPTQLLQDWLHPASGTDPIAIVATVIYLLHFPLPVAVAFALWWRRRRAYYDFVAGLIVLSMAGFATYLLLPVAPPWWAADAGLIPGPDGAAAISYLKAPAFEVIAGFFGFQGAYLYSYAIYEINPNAVAAFPSLHAGYPFLAFLFVRRAIGRPGWAVLAYGALVWFSIVYLADHYVVDVLGGIIYAAVAYALVVHGPAWLRRFVDGLADDEIEATLRDRGSAGHSLDATIRTHLARRVVWAHVAQGLALFAIGSVAIMAMAWGGVLGGSATPAFLVPWVAIFGGLSRAALALLGR